MIVSGWLVLGALGCNGGACASNSGSEKLRTDDDNESPFFRIQAADKKTLFWQIRRSEIDDSNFLIVGEGARTNWAFAIVWEQPTQKIGKKWHPLGKGRCRIRYLQEGRSTEADFMAEEVHIQGHTESRLAIRGVCVKRFNETVRQRPHAAPLPDRIYLSVQAKFVPPP